MHNLVFWERGEASAEYSVSGLNEYPAVHGYITSLIDDRVSNKYPQENIEEDITKAMASQGFYASSLAYEMSETGEQKYIVTPGKRATVSTVKFEPAEYAQETDLKGVPLITVNVLHAQKKIYKKLQEHSCAFDLSVKHKVFLNTKTNSADILFIIQDAKPAQYGSITFSGDVDVRHSYLQKLLNIKEGECFRHDKLDQTRDKILATGLFSRVDIILPEQGSDMSVIPVEFKLKKRAQRTIKAGLSYYTDEGIGGVFGWEHRNFFGSGEKLNIDMSLSKLEQSLEGKITKPMFLRGDQSLNISTSISRADTDAFEEIGADTGVTISRTFNKRLSANIGGELNITKIKEDNEETRTFGLFSPLIAINYDSRDDALDAHKGWLLSANAQGFLDAFGEASPFTKLQFIGHKYYEPHEKIVLAGRMKLGTIIGTQTDDIPATERFFSGGGGSVRGFGHQEIGPKESDGDPAGGRSLFETSFETRLKFTDTLGMVAFIDAGHVGDKIIPTFDEISVGAGVGARYYTDFGPLRFDIGVPVSGKSNTDQNFQIYMSIGQAF